MEKIKKIAFDFGGVIIRQNQQQAVERFKQIGLLDAEERLGAYTQQGIFGELEEGKITAEDFRWQLSLLIGRAVTIEDCSYAWRGYCDGLPQRNLEALQRLRREGYGLSILSNTNPFMMGWALSQDFDGNGHSLADYVDALYLSYQMKVMKPSAEIFRRVLEAESVRPEELLFVDDSSHNISAAQQLGIATFQPVNGEDWTEELFQLLRLP
nr:HAD family phosphatase [uncultured Alloprevotella sp.]